MSNPCWRKYFVLLLFTCLSRWTIAQQPDSASQVHPVDTPNKSGFVTRIQKIGTDETIRSIKKYKAGRIGIKQQFLLEEIRNETQRAKIYLKKGIDTLGISNDLVQTTASVNIVNDGVFVNTGTSQTQRNLAVSSAILTELLFKMTQQKNVLATYTRTLVSFRDKIDSLSSNSELYIFPDDSVNTIKYFKKLLVVAKEIGPTDTAMDQALANVQELQNKVELMVFSLRSSLEDLEKRRIEITEQTLDRELPNITWPVHYSRPFGEIIQFSVDKEKLALNFYIKDNKGRLVILALLILALAFFIRSIRERMIEQNKLREDFNGQLVLRYPILSAFILCTSIFQFIFLEPPFIFSFVLWLPVAICLTFVFNGFISNYWMKFWSIIILLFLLAGIDNIILLQASRTERWLMLGLTISGMAYGMYILLQGHRYELKEKGILYFIGFVVIVEFAASLLNIYGRYNLSKTLMISGYSGVVIAIIFLWTVRLINETLAITAIIYKHPDKKLFYINFDRIGDKVPAAFYFFLVLGWLILVGRNFYEFKQIALPFNDFLNTERTLGDYTFTINGLFIFLLILVCSMLLSRVISFFASDEGEIQEPDKKPGKVGLGSWLLLIRIAIISLGLFLAFAASGIPLDKLTIILGALGVGIGLGLQGLVNNLVSGLIIAFEKPVNVGDVIEVNNKPGTMKSIGFRSSVVTMADGACLIIPNGDLLSQHLINWTMGKNIKRLVVTVGVAYGSDLNKVKQILSTILEKHEKILDYPEPVVVAKEFGASAIEFELLFWVKNIKESLLLKSDIISQINDVFKSEGIVIPYPQQDVHIRTGSTASPI
ncbi:mechanosensitive ion channel family protein [Flavihumibacter profundi]|uniref:mechanosensitive ion channel family protein n=1 Tax=Flavihumibacter profundi TaxID=2716883 RepID=UPI001CC69A5F|nr:mechanosensitive ion channel domain-containing protein [Flavihumibacter profundi]MBZ5855626.1 mechanosensitive ion channel [Flavihumibacter profundi]